MIGPYELDKEVLRGFLRYLRAQRRYIRMNVADYTRGLLSYRSMAPASREGGRIAVVNWPLQCLIRCFQSHMAGINTNCCPELYRCILTPHTAALWVFARRMRIYFYPLTPMALYHM